MFRHKKFVWIYEKRQVVCCVQSQKLHSSGFSCWATKFSLGICATVHSYFLQSFREHKKCYYHATCKQCTNNYAFYIAPSKWRYVWKHAQYRGIAIIYKWFKTVTSNFNVQLDACASLFQPLGVLESFQVEENQFQSNRMFWQDISTKLIEATKIWQLFGKQPNTNRTWNGFGLWNRWLKKKVCKKIYGTGTGTGGTKLIALGL